VISESEAVRRILRTLQPLAIEQISVGAAAIGRFVAQDFFACRNAPEFDNSAFDGYAVRSADCSGNCPTKLRLAGEQAAGIDRQLTLQAGTAIRIFTGAPVPNGADAVIMQEEVALSSDGYVTFSEPVECGQCIRRAGGDLQCGQKVLSRSDRLTARKLSLLASQGLVEVAAHRLPRVAVLSTGDELAQPGSSLQQGQLYESNSTMLLAMLNDMGMNANYLGIARDEVADLQGRIEKGLGNDVLIISGGVSVGERDLVQKILLAIGAQVHFWQVAMKPGKPFLFSTHNNCAVFGLPGNPVSSFVTFLKLVRPALLHLAGAEELSLPVFPAKLSHDLANSGDRPHYIRGNLIDKCFYPLRKQESHALYGLSSSNALVKIEANSKIKAGQEILVEILPANF